MRVPAITVAVLAIAVAPLPAAAQFTAAIVPPAAMLIDSTQLASSAPNAAHQRRATDMRTPALHIDSSLGALGDSVGSTEATTARASARRSASDSPDAGADGEAVFHDGATAPETASSLPLMALVGAGTLLLGVALFRR